MEGLAVENLGIFYDHLVYFTAIGNIYGHLVNFSPFWYFVRKKSGNTEQAIGRVVKIVHSTRK
jgi:hypothetical protein